jgi:NAD(P)H-nitrite reductase large subunit
MSDPFGGVYKLVIKDDVLVSYLYGDTVDGSYY